MDDDDASPAAPAADAPPQRPLWRRVLRVVGGIVLVLSALQLVGLLAALLDATTHAGWGIATPETLPRLATAMGLGTLLWGAIGFIFWRGYRWGLYLLLILLFLSPVASLAYRPGPQSGFEAAIELLGALAMVGLFFYFKFRLARRPTPPPPA